VVTALVAAVGCAFAGSAAAKTTEPEPPEEGAVVKPILTSPKEALRFWTQARLESAEPLSVVTLPEPPITMESPLVPEGSPAQEPLLTFAAPTTGATTAVTTAGQPAPVEGVEVGESESTAFPNRANGKVFGAYLIEGKLEGYECSASVVNSPEGSLILTAAHCAIDRATGAVAKFVIFIPGYNRGAAPDGNDTPYGTWFATKIATPEVWEKTAKSGSSANEGGDLAFLTLLRNEEFQPVERVVGGIGIAFDQPCNQTYTQYGYPAESPYDGQALFSHVAAYGGPDTSASFWPLPAPFKIHSDFTPGSSGGPWTVGPSSSPTALSLTAYGYANQPGVLYGPYFGEAARETYNATLPRKKRLPPGIEEICAPVAETPVVPTPPPSTPTPPEPTPPAETTPPAPPVSLKVTRVRRRANGSAVLVAKVSSAGMLKLSGQSVRAESVNARTAGKYRLVVSPKGVTTRRLRLKGRAKVGVKVAFRASGKTRQIARAIQLSRRSAGRRASGAFALIRG